MDDAIYRIVISSGYKPYSYENLLLWMQESTKIIVEGVPSKDKLKEIAEKEGFQVDDTEFFSGTDFAAIGILGYDKVISAVKVKDEISYVPLKASGDITEDMIYNAANNQDLGLFEIGNNVHGNVEIIMDDTLATARWLILGYDIEKYCEENEIEFGGFYDDTFMCDRCNLIQPYDNGYERNIVNVAEITFGEYLSVGKRCGCYSKVCLENIGSFVNNYSVAVDKELIAMLEACESIEIKTLDLYECGWYGICEKPESIYERVVQEYSEDYVFSEDGTIPEGMLFFIESVSPFNVVYSVALFRGHADTSTEELVSIVEETIDGSISVDKEDEMFYVSVRDGDINVYNGEGSKSKRVALMRAIDELGIDFTGKYGFYKTEGCNNDDS